MLDRGGCNNTSERATIDTHRFYAEWSGHPVGMLRTMVRGLRGGAEDEKGAGASKRRIIWLAGDSSLDNKYWLANRMYPALNGYDYLLSPPSSKPDVCYWMNALLVEKGLGKDHVAINAAVEASTLESRLGSIQEGAAKLRLGHDRLVRDSMHANDTLIVSVGGNDIAMAPSLRTIFSMLVLTRLNSATSIARGSSCVSAYFVRLFGKRVQDYLTAITQGSQRPSRIVVCMIYFPAEAYTESWANTALGALDYNTSPTKLQAAIEYVFEKATRQIEIPGVEVIPFPLFRVLDGKCQEDYVARVEPSVKGGQKMAQRLLDVAL